MRWHYGGLLVGLVLMWATASMAGSVLLSDGNDLLSKCGDALYVVEHGYRGTSYQEVNYGLCVGFISGVLMGNYRVMDNLNNMYQLPAPAEVCLPPNATVDQLLRIIVQHLRASPQTNHLASDLAVVTAVSNVFPCPERGRNYLAEVRRAVCDDTSPAAAPTTPSGVPSPPGPKGAKGK